MKTSNSDLDGLSQFEFVAADSRRGGPEADAKLAVSGFYYWQRLKVDQQTRPELFINHSEPKKTNLICYFGLCLT